MYCTPKSLLLGAWRQKAQLGRALLRGLWALGSLLAMPLGIYGSTQVLGHGLPQLPGSTLSHLDPAEFVPAIACFLVALLFATGNLVRVWRQYRRDRQTDVVPALSVLITGFFTVLSLLLWWSAQFQAASEPAGPALWHAGLSVGWNLVLLPLTAVVGLGMLAAALVVVGLVVFGVAKLGAHLVTETCRSLHQLCQAGRGGASPKA